MKKLLFASVKQSQTLGALFINMRSKEDEKTHEGELMRRKFKVDGTE